MEKGREVFLLCLFCRLGKLKTKSRQEWSYGFFTQLMHHADPRTEFLGRIIHLPISFSPSPDIFVYSWQLRQYWVLRSGFFRSAQVAVDLSGFTQYFKLFGMASVSFASGRSAATAAGRRGSFFSKGTDKTAIPDQSKNFLLFTDMWTPFPGFKMCVRQYTSIWKIKHMSKIMPTHKKRRRSKTFGFPVVIWIYRESCARSSSETTKKFPIQEF